MSDLGDALASGATGFLNTVADLKIRKDAEKRARKRRLAEYKTQLAVKLAEKTGKYDLLRDAFSSGDNGLPVESFIPALDALASQKQQEKAAAQQQQTTKEQRDLLKLYLQGDQYDAARQLGQKAGFVGAEAIGVSPIEQSLIEQRRAGKKRTERLTGLDAQRKQIQIEQARQRLANLKATHDHIKTTYAIASKKLDKINRELFIGSGLQRFRTENADPYIKQLETLDGIYDKQEKALLQEAKSALNGIADSQSIDDLLAGKAPATDPMTADIQRSLAAIRAQRARIGRLIKQAVGVKETEAGIISEEFKAKARAWLAQYGQPTSDEAIKRVFEHPEHRRMVEAFAGGAQ